MSTRGERIRQALEGRGVRKQQALAAELKVHESAITRWKENAAMSLENAVAFSTVLDVSLDWLLLGRGTMDSHRVVSESDEISISTYGALKDRLSPRIGQQSLALLVQAIEAIAEEAMRAGKQ